MCWNEAGSRMTTGGVGVRRAVYVGRTLEGHVGSDWERGVTGLQVFELQFPIDQFSCNSSQRTGVSRFWTISVIVL